MNKSESIGVLTKALSLAQAEIKGAVKDSNNPFFKADYADLSSVWDACREALTKNNLAIFQPTDVSDQGVVVETVISHESGEWVSGRLLIHPTKNDPQGIGSAITYARRYALASMVGVCPADDDGEGAMGRDKKDKTNGSTPPGRPATPQEVPASSPGSPAPLLSYEQLSEKVTTSENAFELQARWKKYGTSIVALSEPGKKELTATKDKMKKLFEVCTKDTVTCKETIADGSGNVGCAVTHLDCIIHKKEK